MLFTFASFLLVIVEYVCRTSALPKTSRSGDGRKMGLSWGDPVTDYVPPDDYEQRGRHHQGPMVEHYTTQLLLSITLL